jgi:hypothetical protein
MLTNQTSEISLTSRAENLVIPDTVKRTRMDSPPKVREESQKKPKNQHNQMLMIEDQRSSEVSQKEMFEVLKTRMLNSEKRQSISEKRQSISEKAVSADHSTPREDSGCGKEKSQMGKYCIGLQEENQSTGKHRPSSTKNYHRTVKHNNSLESTSSIHPEEIGVSPEINKHCSTGLSASSVQGESRFTCKTNIIQDDSRGRGIESEGRIRLWFHEGQRSEALS